MYVYCQLLYHHAGIVSAWSVHVTLSALNIALLPSCCLCISDSCFSKYLTVSTCHEQHVEPLLPQHAPFHVCHCTMQSLHSHNGFRPAVHTRKFTIRVQDFSGLLCTQPNSWLTDSIHTHIYYTHTHLHTWVPCTKDRGCGQQQAKHLGGQSHAPQGKNPRGNPQRDINLWGKSNWKPAQHNRVCTKPERARELHMQCGQCQDCSSSY